MKELKIIKKYTKFTHKEGSTYNLEEYGHDKYHGVYKEINEEGWDIFHIVSWDDRKEWDELCELYPHQK